MSKQAAATKVERKKFKLENVRLSYPSLDKPSAMQNDDGTSKEPEYSANFILHKKKHAAIIAAVIAEAKRLVTAKCGKLPIKLHLPVRDGASYINATTQEIKDGYGEEFMGITAKSRSKQMCVDRNKQRVDESVLYAGCYVNTVITLYVWNNPKKGWGCSANLGPIQFFKNGERFGGAVLDADEEFDDLGDDDDGEEEDEKPAKKKKSKPAPADDDDDEDPTAGL